MRFTSSIWWINIWRALICFVPECLLAAALWTVAGVLVALGSWKGLQMFAAGTVVDLPLLLQSAAILLGATVVGFTLIVWSLVLWLSRITAFTGSWLRLPIMSEPLAMSVIRESQKEAIANLKLRKAFLTRYWLCISLFLFPMMLVVGTMFCIKIVTIKEVVGTPLITLPPIASDIMMFMMSLIMIVATAISIVALAIAATTERTPMQAALHTLKLSAENWLPLLLVTTAVVIVDVVGGSPQVLLKLGNPDSMFTLTHTVTELIIENVWQGVSSVLLCTFTVAPVVELVRNATYKP